MSNSKYLNIRWHISCISSFNKLINSGPYGKYKVLILSTERNNVLFKPSRLSSAWWETTAAIFVKRFCVTYQYHIARDG